MKVALLLVALLSAAASAQELPRVDVSFGDAFTRVNFIGTEAETMNGWNATFGANILPWLGAEADVSGHYGTFLGQFRTSAHYFLAGPRVTAHFGKGGAFQPPRFSPFAHVLVGGTRAALADLSDTAFTWGVGGGLDLNLSDRISIRVPKVDYLRTSFDDGRQDNWRIGIGGVYRFGPR